MTRSSHIKHLAKGLNAEVSNTLGSWEAPYSIVDERIVCLGRWSKEESLYSAQYWIALHELGHIALGHDRENISGFALMLTGLITGQEADAWLWGIEHSAFPLDASGKASIAFSIASYIVNQGVDAKDDSKISKLVLKAESPNWDSLSFMSESDLNMAKLYWPLVMASAKQVVNGG